NALAANFTSTFTTDSISPTVVSSVPAINATLVNPAAPLSLTFSEPIDPASVTYSTTISTGSVSLAAGAAQVFGCFSFNPTSTVVTFTPLAPLTAATGHSFSASAGVTDLGGLALTPYTAPFTTQ
ncbi:MAG TPA: Ig-like domain-containing protein, partial [Myxococcales bacterium]